MQGREHPGPKEPYSRTKARTKGGFSPGNWEPASQEEGTAKAEAPRCDPQRAMRTLEKRGWGRILTAMSPGPVPGGKDNRIPAGVCSVARLAGESSTSRELGLPLDPFSEQAPGTTSDPLLLTHRSESPSRASSSAIAGLGREQTSLSFPANLITQAYK